MLLNLNRANLTTDPLNESINAQIERRRWRSMPTTCHVIISARR